MNCTLVDKLARALLYEGYILYPYRPSVKNSHRWTFGGLYPRSWTDAQSGSDASMMQTECLVSGSDQPRLQSAIRFLHLVDRTVGEVLHPRLPVDQARQIGLLPAAEPEFRRVQVLEVDEKRYVPWQEAVERSVELDEVTIADLLATPRRQNFEFPAKRWVESILSSSDLTTGLLIREQQCIHGAVELSAIRLEERLFRVRVQIVNETEFADPTLGRDEALMRSLISTHTILGVSDGEFISLLEPPDQWRDQAAACKNIGVWPVLVGTAAERDTILSSPIILYDYPQLAPESPGDLFDSTEIDEILTLRIMTLTDEEKRSAASVDDRSREMLARTESLAREQLMNLHGTVRGLRPVPQEQIHG